MPTAVVFTAATFLSAFLLFWVQPLYSKMVLPLLGGSPAVWNAAMMFFQVTLLAGYGYAHLLTKWIGPTRRQLFVHGMVLAVGLAFLPLAVSQTHMPPTTGSPVPWLLALLVESVGWPF